MNKLHNPCFLHTQEPGACEITDRYLYIINPIELAKNLDKQNRKR